MSKIFVHPIEDPEAALQCEYIGEDAFNKTHEYTSQEERYDEFRTIKRNWQSRVFDQRECLTIHNRVRRWIIEQKKMPLTSYYHWWVTQNIDDTFRPEGDIGVNYYAKCSPATGTFLIWNNVVTPKSSTMYMFPGNTPYKHAHNNHPSHDRLIIHYSFTRE